MIEVPRIVRIACAAAAVALASAVPAIAHDDPHEDASVVEDRLHHMGFVEWRNLRYSHGIWKIDNAKRANGHVYNLQLESGSFDLVRLTRERS